MRLHSRLLVGLVALLVFLQLTYPHRAWMTLLIGLGGVWLLAYLWARSLRRSLRLERELRSPWSQVGDEMLERLTLTNSGWAPAHAVEVLDHSNLPGGGRSRVIAVGGFAANRWHQSSICQQRGVYDVGPTTLSAADPFGLYEVELHQPAKSSVTVLPPTVELPIFHLVASGNLSEGQARRIGHGRSVSASSVRSYLPGDSLRRVHWPTSAHHGELYIKKADPIAGGDWWIFLDLNRAVQVGEGRHSTEEHGVVLAASLAAAGLKRGRSVGLVTQDETGSITWLTPAPGARQRWTLLRRLATARQGTHTLTDLLRAAESRLHRPASLLLITPAGPADWTADLDPLLSGHARARAFVLDRSSYDPDFDPSGVDRSGGRAGLTLHVIGQDFVQSRMPELQLVTDWRQTQLQEQPWRQLSP